MLSTVTVMNNHDSGPGSLRAAIAAAASGDTIQFANSLKGQTITLTTGELDITTSLNIDGPGAGLLTVSGRRRQPCLRGRCRPERHHQRPDPHRRVRSRAGRRDLERRQ